MSDKSKITRVINRSSARALGKVFMSCYKRGVNDACAYSDDEGLILEHIEQTESGERFGFIDAPAGSVLYWRNRLYELAEELKCYSQIHGYFIRMGRFRANYLSVAVLMAQTFYNRGLRDYLEYPYNDISKFNEGEGRRIWWSAKGLRPFDSYKLRTYIQDLCAMRMERINNGATDPLRAHQYEMFSTAFSFAIVARL